jgi:hypothetical protein
MPTTPQRGDFVRVRTRRWLVEDERSAGEGLREVACLYGLTRFEPAPLATDELEDVGLAVSGAPLAQTPEWLPAVEQFGEGFFLQFAPEALAHWLSEPGVLTRARQLQAGATAWIQAKRAKGILVARIASANASGPSM